MADRVERLTNLLATLLETAEPLSLIEIGGALEGQYSQSPAARRGAFERDKAALRDIGVPIESEIVGGGEYAGQTRYWIDRARYELRDLELDDDEMRALQVAMAATRPGSSVGQDALWKLGGGILQEGGAVAAIVPDDPSLPLLRDAVATRTAVKFRYRDLDRIVEPWGILLRSGFWYLIGFDRGRDDRRTYRIDRISGTPGSAKAAMIDGDTFDRPSDFDASAAFPADPKAIGADPSSPDARVWISAARARATAAELGPERVLAERPDGSIEVAVPSGNEPAFRSWLFGYLEHAAVLEPEHLRASVIEWLEGLAS